MLQIQISRKGLCDVKKLSTIDQMIVDITDKEKYNLYRCEEHGMFSVRKDIEEQVCSYCKKECEKYVE